MLTAIRKLFGFVALVWLGWVALNLVVFGISVATGMSEGSRSSSGSIPSTKARKRNPTPVQSKSRSSPTDSPTMQAARLAGEMFLVSWFTSPAGTLSCLVWFGLKLVQGGQRKDKGRVLRRAHPVARHYMDFGGWFDQRKGQPVFSHGKHAGRLLREVARKDPEYLHWMLGEDLPQDTKRIVADALEREHQPIERREAQRRGYKPLPVPLESEVRPPVQPPEVFTYEAPGLSLCPTCGLRPGLFYCRPHQSPLCLSCVGPHDSPAECSYIPAWRKEAAFSGLSQPANAVYSYEAPRLPKCPQCKRRPALFYCRAHCLSICLDCLGSHDVPAECSYVPGWRAEKSDDEGAPTDAGGTIRVKPKTGDVFGIS
jgi:hypothetical protein